MRKEATDESSISEDSGRALRAALAELEASGASHIDPVRFRYLQTLAIRSTEQHARVASYLEQQAWRALHEYEVRVVAQREQAARSVEELAARHHKPSAGDSLGALIRQLEANEGDDDAAHAQPVRDESHAGPQADVSQQASVSDVIAPVGTQLRELKTAHTVREALQQQHADNLVSRALLEAPESAGPLNPQKLALRSLAIMREHSPAYLGRFVSYVETVFWLEEVDGITTK